MIATPLHPCGHLLSAMDRLPVQRKPEVIAQWPRPTPDVLPLNATLETTSCRLRRLQREDMVMALSAMRDAQRLPSRWPRPATDDLDALEGFYLRAREAWVRGSAYAWSVTPRYSDRAVGRMELVLTDTPDVWHICGWMHPLFRRRTLLGEALPVLLKLVFERFHAIRVNGDCVPGHENCARILLGAGFFFVRRRTQAIRHASESVQADRYTMGLDDWLRAQVQQRGEMGAAGQVGFMRSG